jgi:hypothetical protein
MFYSTPGFCQLQADEFVQACPDWLWQIAQDDRSIHKNTEGAKNRQKIFFHIKITLLKIHFNRAPFLL